MPRSSESCFIGLPVAPKAAESRSGRFVLWEVAVEDFVSNPLLGVGTHNYEATYYQERDQQVGYVR